MAEFKKADVVRQPLGRPSSYRVEYAQQLLDYFEQPAFPTKVRQPDGSEVVIAGKFPTLAAFSNMVGVTQNTLRNWADAKDMDDVTPLFPEFFRAYYKARDYQEQYLLEGYTSGAYQNPGFAALIAKNLLAWKDKQDVETVSTVSVAAHVTHEVPGLTDRFAAFDAKKADAAE